MDFSLDDANHLQVLGEIIQRELEKIDIEGLIRDRNLVGQDANELLGSDLFSHDFHDHVHTETTRPKGRLEAELVSNKEVQNIVEEVKDKVLSQMNLSASNPQIKEVQGKTYEAVANGLSRGAVFLALEVHEGRAFVGLGVGDSDDEAAQMSLHLAFGPGGQRFHSRQFACVSNPKIGETFYIELAKPGLGDASLLGLSDPLHLVLLRHDSGEHRQLVSSTEFDWRPLLCEASLAMRRSVRLNGVGAEAQVSAGLLDVTARLLYSGTRQIDRFSSDLVQQQLAMERGRRENSERLFVLYASQWWSEYCAARAANADRLVKIFAKDECGRDRPVFELVKPLRAGRLIESPRHAARFVACLQYERAAALGCGLADMWCSRHAFLARGRGDTGDHAALLCSLLLGFGLDAYVAFGAKAPASSSGANAASGSPVAWVVTLSQLGSSAEPASVHFWDPVNGQRFLHSGQQQSQHPYTRIGCLFNHRSFYANNQASDAVASCRFDLDDSARWKPMSEEAIGAALTGGPTPPGCLATLSAPLLDAVRESNQFELRLRAAVAERREADGLGATQWDEELSFCLTGALAGYEQERLHGVAFANEEFQAAMNRLVPDGHTFRGYPLQVLHRDPRRALAAALRSPVGREVVFCRGDRVRLCARARVVCYAESACATWLMIGCTYQAAL
ncbi:hypothetical protein BOX15_Mlig033726g2 [Macrostomum lignano]|uniref:Uncharacterized protein n=1 Tax=Macrostomum lignano TaxID=282301 RepID=A0A267ENM4_9PLAT|nr:hypothetical protein BOX15_Mlig033726g2 [Macrostomum lignano]